MCFFKCVILRNVPSRYIYTRNHGDAFTGIPAMTSSCLSYLIGTYATDFITCCSSETTEGVRYCWFSAFSRIDRLP